MVHGVSRRQFLTGLAAAAATAATAQAGRMLYPQQWLDLGTGSIPLPPLYLPFVAKRSTTVSPVQTIYDIIRQEATAQDSAAHHPLPLIGSWNAATWWNFDAADAGLYPGWQLEMIEQNHHLLPWFEIPLPETESQSGETPDFARYFEAPIKRAAQFHLPISFVGVEWEHYLYDDPAYLHLPPDQNPNVISTLDGTIQATISPFGPVGCWYEVGNRWGASPMMQQVISWYPDPPAVLFVSNNEAKKLRWPEAETDRHYVDLYGHGANDNVKRRLFADAWTKRYGALIQGFRDGLGNLTWQAQSKFIGYQAFGPGWFGAWNGWKEYSLFVPGRIDPSPLYWQGGSSPLYICGECNELDNIVQGPAFQAMNWVFMLNEARRLRPSFWYEFSSWDGDEDAQRVYAQVGQSLTPERYQGLVQFGMWLVRPRVVRVYRDWDQSRAEVLPWFTPILQAVDRIYADPILQSFWRGSALVPNPVRPHPYQSDIPPEYSAVERMFALETDRQPADPWQPDTGLPVIALARVLGEAPRRQWLLYAYAPLGPKRNVHIRIPGYMTVTVDVALQGTFYVLNEADGEVRPISETG